MQFRLSLRLLSIVVLLSGLGFRCASPTHFVVTPVEDPYGQYVDCTD